MSVVSTSFICRDGATATYAQTRTRCSWLSVGHRPVSCSSSSLKDQATINSSQQGWLLGSHTWGAISPVEILAQILLVWLSQNSDIYVMKPPCDVQYLTLRPSSMLLELKWSCARDSGYYLYTDEWNDSSMRAVTGTALQFSLHRHAGYVALLLPDWELP